MGQHPGGLQSCNVMVSSLEDLYPLRHEEELFSLCVVTVNYLLIIICSIYDRNFRGNLPLMMYQAPSQSPSLFSVSPSSYFLSLQANIQLL